MVVYSARLAVSTTADRAGVLGPAQVPDFGSPSLVAVPFLAWSLARLLRTHRAGRPGRPVADRHHRAGLSR